MKDLETIKSVYLLGIGGIGMSALARYFHKKGAQVSGYDKTATSLTGTLEAEGIKVHYDTDTAHISDAELYVYTPAIPADHPAFEFVRKSGHHWYKRSEVLEGITAQYKTIAIAGTHGKTTTTAILAHILHISAGNALCFVGGIVRGPESNVIMSRNPEYMVVEADEFDRSFLRLNPHIAVITSLDPDHLDVYGTFEAMKKDYCQFASRANCLIVNERVAHHFDHPNKLVYGAGDDAVVRYSNVEVIQGAFRFQLNGGYEFTLRLPGTHNVENATAALAVSLSLGLTPTRLVDAVSTFNGVKRRFERAVETQHFVLIDDYAHHPEEIKAAIAAARMLYPYWRILVVFQPHLYSRTRDFEMEFAESLSKADHLILMPIYPAREEPIKGVSSENLLNKVSLKSKQLVEKSEVVKAVLSLSAEVVLVLGAGDIDQLVKPISNALRKNISSE